MIKYLEKSARTEDAPAIDESVAETGEAVEAVETVEAPEAEASEAPDKPEE